MIVWRLSIILIKVYKEEIIKKEIENIIKEYEEIKTINECTIDKLNNENLMIDMFLRDIKMISHLYKQDIEILKELNHDECFLHDCSDDYFI